MTWNGARLEYQIFILLFIHVTFAGGGSIIFVFSLCACFQESNISLQLSRGLAYLGQLINARSYDKRHKLLNPLKDRKRFISKNFWYPCRHREYSPDGTLLLVAYHEEQMKKLVHPRSIVDLDLGPAEVWRVAHMDKSCDEFVF